MTRRHLPLLITLTLTLSIGCDGTDDTTIAGVEAGSPNPAGVEAGTPAGVEAGTPAGVEAGTPAGVEAGTPAGVEAGTPAGVEAGTPAGVEAGTPAGVEAGTPAGVEAGTPAGVEAATPAGVEAGTPAGMEAGVEGGSPAAEGACTNEADLSRFMTLGEDGIDSAVEMCVFASCLGASTDATACTECIENGTNLSQGCSTCFVEAIVCTLESCFGECANLADPAPCDECREQNCIPQFDTCAGDLMQ